MKIGDLCKSCQAISAIKDAVRSRKEAGIFTDADDKFLADSDKEMANLKEKLAKTLEAAPPKGKPLAKTGWDDDQEEELNGFFCNLLQEGDANVKGNVALAAAFIKKVPLDYPTLCEERALLSEAAADGNLIFMDQLLGIPGNDQFDKIDLLTSTLYSQLYRIPATLILFKHAKTAFADFKDDDFNEEAKSLFQEFMVEIGHTKKANVRENRTGRIELFDKLINNKALGLDPEDEGDDCQTVVSRAAYNGDSDLLALLFGCKKVKDINRIQPDRTTALIQAVFANSVECVMMILSQPGVDVNYEADDGNAMALASVLKRDPAIIAILKKHGGKEGEKSPLGNLKKLEAKAAPAPEAAAAAPSPPPAAKGTAKAPAGKEPKAKSPPPAAAAGKKKPPAPASGKKSTPALKSTDSSSEIKKPPPKAGAKAPSAPAPKPTPPPGKPPVARGRGSGTATTSATPSGPMLVTSGSPDFDNMSAAFKTSITLVSMTFYRWVNAASRTQQHKRQLMVLKMITHAKGKPMERTLLRCVFRLWLRMAYRTRAGKLAIKKILGGMASETRRQSLAAAGALSSPSPPAAARGRGAAGGRGATGSGTSLLKGGGRGGGGAAAARQGAAVEGGKMSIADILSMIHLSKLSLQSRISMGIFTDEEEAKQKETEKEILQQKRNLQAELTEKHKKKKTLYEPSDDDERDHIEALVDDLLKELDTNEENASLFRLLLECIKMDWPALCEDKGYLSSAACDGSLEYMQALLSYPNIRFDVVDVVLSSLYNQTHRIPCVTLLFRHERVLLDQGLEEHLDELMDAFHEFVADIASHKRSDNPKEVRTGRLQLIEKLYTHKIIKLDICAEGDSDSQTVFSRAAFEGDHELMSLLLKLRKAPDINRVQSNRTTALIQAVISNSVSAVALILAQSGVDVNYVSPDGTALTMGIGLKRDLGIVQKLKSMGAKQQDGSTLPPIKQISTAEDGDNDVHGISSSEQEAGTPGAPVKAVRKAAGAAGGVKLPNVNKGKDKDKVAVEEADETATEKPAEKKKPIKAMAAAAAGGGKVKKKF